MNPVVIFPHSLLCCDSEYQDPCSQTTCLWRCCALSCLIFVEFFVHITPLFFVICLRFFAKTILKHSFLTCPFQLWFLSLVHALGVPMFRQTNIRAWPSIVLLYAPPHIGLPFLPFMSRYPLRYPHLFFSPLVVDASSSVSNMSLLSVNIIRLATANQVGVSWLVWDVNVMSCGLSTFSYRLFLYHMLHPSVPLIDLSILIMPWVFLDSALVLRLSFCWMVGGGAVMLCGHCDLQVEILMLWV